MRLFLRGEGLQSPSLPEGLELGEPPWEGPSSANGALQEWFAVAKTEQGPKVDFGGATNCPGQELALRCVQHALWSSQLEHDVLENCAC